jgi:tRNA (Thr-GGU) A37 N-methylase
MTESISAGSEDKQPEDKRQTVVEYIQRQRQRLTEKKIDLHEYGTILRDVKPFVNYLDVLELERLQKEKRK